MIDILSYQLTRVNGIQSLIELAEVIKLMTVRKLYHYSQFLIEYWHSLQQFFIPNTSTSSFFLLNISISSCHEFIFAKCIWPTMTLIQRLQRMILNQDQSHESRCFINYGRRIEIDKFSLHVSDRRVRHQLTLSSLPKSPAPESTPARRSV